MVLRRRFFLFTKPLQLLVKNSNFHSICLQNLIRHVTKMAEQNEPLRFNSRSKAPYDKLSNFYCAKIDMPEGTFGSVEHYFQAMKFIDKDHSRFEVDGDLGKQGINSGTWKDTVSKGRFIKSAGGKTGTQKYKLTLRSDGLDRERAKQKMKEAMRKKFEIDPFKSLLVATEQRTLVHTPVRGKTDFWTGRVDESSGEIKGENTMGKLLMEVREELRNAAKTGRNQLEKGSEDNLTGKVLLGEGPEMDEKSKTGEMEVGAGKKRKFEDDDDEGKPQRRADAPEVRRKKVEERSCES